MITNLKYYCLLGREEEARSALQRLRLSSSAVDTEFSEIKQVCLEANNQRDGDVRISDFGRSGLYYKPMVVALGLMALQQLCGINPVRFLYIQL